MTKATAAATRMQLQLQLQLKLLLERELQLQPVLQPGSDSKSSFGKTAQFIFSLNCRRYPRGIPKYPITPTWFGKCDH